MGAGFSFGNTGIDSIRNAGDEFINFVKAFTAMYPEYKHPDGVYEPVWYLAAESDANRYLLEYHDLFDCKEPIPGVEVKRFLMGNPCTEPYLQKTSA